MVERSGESSDEAGTSRRYRRGQVVEWEGERFRVKRRRAVDGFAMPQTGTHELFLASLDGGLDPEWVPENEVQPAAG